MGNDAMTVTDTSGVLEGVRRLTPAITGRSAEIEEARTLPHDLLDELVAAGCFRSLVPRTHGGDETALVDHLVMLEELARADGSVGWTVMIGAAAPVLLGHLPAASFDAVYAGGPDVITAGTFNPTGTATRVDGGYHVSGRWSFASGCRHADRFIAHCRVDDGSVPPLRMMVLPAADVRIVDTWSTLGMCGTGSHDFIVADLAVADEWTFSVFAAPELDFPALRIPELCLSTMAFAAVAVGIAAGALAEITELATSKVTMFADAPLAANPLFRNQIGEAHATLRAARALLHQDASAAWAAALEGAEFDDSVRACFRSATTWITTTAAHVVDVAYRAGGGTALYTSSPLQRRLRDIHTLTQHFGVKLDTYTLAGAVLAGQDVDTSFL
jgi:alkylation response protein AidB-like acyl-CoA dehydrogenase